MQTQLIVQLHDQTKGLGITYIYTQWFSLTIDVFCWAKHQDEKG